MDIVIAGGHGKVAMHLHRLLVGRGHKVRGLIRDPGQAGDLAAAGALPVLCDLELTGDISNAVGPADAVIFAAGSGRVIAGHRGAPALDREAVIDAIVALGQFALDAGDRIEAVDINPLMARAEGQGVCVADALVVVAPA